MSTATGIEAPTVHSSDTPTHSRTSRSAAAVAQDLAHVGNAVGEDAPDLERMAQHMYGLMLRNVASDGFTFSDPQSPTDMSRNSKPGCVIAAPSFPAETPGIDEDYVFNWVRDAAITAMELAAAQMAIRPGGAVQPLNNYVAFAELCRSTAPTPGHACFTIAGQPRPWTVQNDGPALQCVAVLAAYPQLDDASKTVALGLVNANVSYLLRVYKDPTTNLWEEHAGFSFFARSAQLRCFQEVSDSAIAGIAKPPELKDAISWLRGALDGHWDATNHRYVSLMTRDGTPSNPVASDYDPNIDVVQACIYGAVRCTDPKLLGTAAQLRQQWEKGGIAFYPINAADQQLGLGPLFGRYPGDVYDGDTSQPKPGGHPWALCTCNMAELHYRLATQIRSSAAGKIDDVVAINDLTEPFFTASGVTAATVPSEAAAKLIATGDAMLQAVVYHSDNLELSEQFDGTSGYEKSVDNLTWSYAAFLSAVRARTATHVAG